MGGGIFLAAPILLAALFAAVFIHEWAHLRAGLRLGAAVRSFNLGFGPLLWSRTRGGIEYAFRAVPLGGYVQFWGARRPESGDEQAPEGTGLNWWELSLWRRLAISSAGSAINLAAGTCALFILDVFHLGRVGAPMVMWDALVISVRIFGNLLLNPLGAMSSDSLTGPVGAAQMLADIGVHPINILALAAVINISLGLFNLLPVPPLDGGTMVLNAADAGWRRFRGRGIPQKVTLAAAAVGTAWICLVAFGALAGDFL